MLIDTDVVARDVVAPGEPGLALIAQAFGADVLEPDGQLNRRALRSLVFADSQAKQRLEALLHPLIRARTLDLMASMEGAVGPDPNRAEAYQIIVVPLLIETDFSQLVDRVLVIDCAEAVQLKRLIARDDLTEAEARRMLASQAARERRLACADDVIDNSGTLRDLEEAVGRQHARYQLLAATAAPR